LGAFVAITFLNTTLIVGAVFLLFGNVLKNHRALGIPTANSQALPTVVREYGWDRVARAYPGWSPDDLTVLLAERDLTAVPVYEAFTQHRPRAMRGRFTNVSPNGYRAIQDQGPWPPDPAAFNVFLFGGSTAFGIALPDNQTIASYLQQRANQAGCTPRVQVYNFGRPTYLSSQERILFEQLLLAGTAPSVAVFLDGLNDFILLDGLPYLTSHLTESLDAEAQALSGRRGDLGLDVELLPNLPIGSSATTPSLSGANQSTVLHEVVARWLANRKLIEAIGQQLGVQTVFVWQPVPVYRYDLSYHNFHTDPSSFPEQIQPVRDGYELMSQTRSTTDLGTNFLWLADLQQGRRENLYVDSIHYTAPFSSEIADMMLRFLRDQRFVPCA
jgi:hypothetical protein